MSRRVDVVAVPLVLLLAVGCSRPPDRIGPGVVAASSAAPSSSSSDCSHVAEVGTRALNALDAYQKSGEGMNNEGGSYDAWSAAAQEWAGVPRDTCLDVIAAFSAVQQAMVGRIVADDKAAAQQRVDAARAEWDRLTG